jgi:hypothetical protein
LLAHEICEEAGEPDHSWYRLQKVRPIYELHVRFTRGLHEPAGIERGSLAPEFFSQRGSTPVPADLLLVLERLPAGPAPPTIAWEPFALVTALDTQSSIIDARAWAECRQSASGGIADCSAGRPALTDTRIHVLRANVEPR